MCGKRVVRDCQFLGDISSRETSGTVTHQEPEHLQTTGLRKCRQGIDCVCFVHMSSIIELKFDCKIWARVIGQFDGIWSHTASGAYNAPSMVRARLIIWPRMVWLESSIWELSACCRRLIDISSTLGACCVSECCVCQ